jgi:ABC-type branched-subunit amino acid transport system ATPase component
VTEVRDGDHSAGLALMNITVHYGGHRAVHDVSLAAPSGRLTGLIGPNGAGKTTAFNVCSGLVRPSSGQAQLFGMDVTSLAPSRRALLGLGRTFQRMQLWTSMTVYENVVVGVEAGSAGSSPVRTAAAVSEALSICGLQEAASRRVGALSTGQRRLVELARAYAAGFRVLLLDEPSSGLDQGETQRLGDIVQMMAKDKGVGILLVEHDMALVMSVCEYIYVLDFGELVFEGTPTEVRASDVVQAAYLGSESGLRTAEGRAGVA